MQLTVNISQIQNSQRGIVTPTKLSIRLYILIQAVAIPNLNFHLSRFVELLLGCGVKVCGDIWNSLFAHKVHLGCNCILKCSAPLSDSDNTACLPGQL